MRNRYNEQLETLSRELIVMASLCEEAISDSTKALSEGGEELVKQVLSLEKEIDSKEREIESLCLKMLLQQQPVAGDLRHISAALKMITDLERIGDQAADIVEVSAYLRGAKPAVFDTITKMASESVHMVRESIDAFVKQDIVAARAVIAYDDIIDALFDRVRGDVIECINAKTVDGEEAVDYLMIAKYLERIGDHALNVAEWVEFSITGRHRELEETV